MQTAITAQMLFWREKRPFYKQIKRTCKATDINTKTQTTKPNK